ncbi:MAG: glycosyltransferase family 4 protein [Acidobacteria bacterium]|nr:glycosyltransferase family 4 protein [Acidobacteriota bacterium]
MGMTEPLPTVHVDLEPGWRGGQRQVFLLCAGLARRGHPVALVGRRRSELTRRAAEAGVEVVETPVSGGLDPRAVRVLVDTVRRRRPAVVGLHSSRSHNVGMMARILLGRDRPLFVVTRRVDFPPGRDLLNRVKYRRGADGYIAISRAVEQELLGAGIPPERIRIVHSGVEPPVVPPESRRELREALDIPQEAPVLGVVAALTDHKGHRYLLDAMPRVLGAFPNAVLLLAGDGELREELETQTAELGLAGAVRFLGYRNDVPRILGALDLFIMPSRLEGLGTSVVDAMLAGVPVVATSAGGLPELIENGVTGLLAEPRSPESLAARILEVMGNTGLRQRIAERALQVARERFTADAMVEGTLRAYGRLLNRPERR